MTNILPAKLVPERITVKFNFLDEMEWGENLTLAISELEVLSGMDPLPNLMLRLQPVISGTEVSQQIRLGTPGVIYKLQIEATTNTGRVLSKSSTLAIMPSDAASPLPFGEGFSSALYPLYSMEAFDSTGFAPIQGGDFIIPLEAFNSQFTILSGILSGGIAVFTAPTEAFNAVSFTPLNGTLASLVLSYTNWPFEGINGTSFLPLGGTITQIVVSYPNYPAEGINATAFTPLSGTLT